MRLPVSSRRNTKRSATVMHSRNRSSKPTHDEVTLITALRVPDLNGFNTVEGLGPPVEPQALNRIEGSGP